MSTFTRGSYHGSSYHGITRSQAWVDGLGLQGQDGEDAFVDAPDRAAARDAVEGLQAQVVLAQGEAALVAEAAIAQAGQVGRLGIVGMRSYCRQAHASGSERSRLRYRGAVSP